MRWWLLGTALDVPPAQPGGRSAPFVGVFVQLLSVVVLWSIPQCDVRALRRRAKRRGRLLTVDHSARESMKDAAKCEK